MLKRRIKRIWELLRRSAKKYKSDDPVRLAGTTAYFTVFALAPIIIIIISVIGLLLGQERIEEKVFTELDSLLGGEGAKMVKGFVENYQDTDRDIIGTIIGFVIFIFSATTFFTVLQKSLNYVWRIRAKPSKGYLKTLKDRVLSFGLVLSLGFLLLVSLVIDATISIFRDFLIDRLPDFTVFLIRVGNFLISFGIIMVIFAMIYKFLPDARIKWKVTWMGAFITAILFIIGRSLIGIFLGNANVGLMYGAAGSIFVVLLWVFYTSIIFFFGAEITQQYAEMYRHGIKPKDNAVTIEISEVREKEE
jgi:membrane protein